MIVGYATSVWFYLDDRMGLGAGGAVEHYLGAVDSGASVGPALDLPNEMSAMRLEKPPRQVMETFHFHLFSVSVCLLILSHLFMMCSLPRAVRLGVIGVGSVVTAVHLIAPLLIRFVSPGFGHLMFPSAAVMALSWFAMTGWPLWDMWRPREQDKSHATANS